MKNLDRILNVTTNVVDFESNFYFSVRGFKDLVIYTIVSSEDAKFCFIQKYFSRPVPIFCNRLRINL